MSQNQFEKPLKLMKLCLFMSGIRVDYKNKSSLVEPILTTVFFSNIIILYAVIFAEIAWVVDGIIIGRDFVELSLTAPCITISILNTIKTVPLYYKNDVVCQIFDTLENIHPKLDKNRKCVSKKNKINDVKRIINNEYERDDENVEEKLLNEAITMIKRVGLLLSSVSTSVLIMFLFTPMLIMYWGYYQTGELKIMYPFTVKYWFDAYELKLWPLMYFLQSIAGMTFFYLSSRSLIAEDRGHKNIIFGQSVSIGSSPIIVCANISATETLFCSVCTYLEMHFHILCHNLESIQSGSSNVYQILVAGVKKHQLLMHLVDQIESLFSIPVLLHIVSSSLLICLAAFNISVAKDLTSVFAFVTFLVLSLSQISLLCYFGDKLMRSSTEVSGSIYNCPWFDFENNAKKLVFIIIMRSQKPCKITAWNFADVNLRAFTTILSRSWSYFALLKTVYK